MALVSKILESPQPCQPSLRPGPHLSVCHPEAPGSLTYSPFVLTLLLPLFPTSSFLNFTPGHQLDLFPLTRVSLLFPHLAFLCLAPWGSHCLSLFPSSEVFPTGPCETRVCWDLLARYLASGNTSVAPCTDFFSFACGQAKGISNSFQALAEENKNRLRRILGKECRVEDSLCQCVTLSLEPSVVGGQLICTILNGLSGNCLSLLLCHCNFHLGTNTLQSLLAPLFIFSLPNPCPFSFAIYP